MASLDVSQISGLVISLSVFLCLTPASFQVDFDAEVLSQTELLLLQDDFDEGPTAWLARQAPKAGQKGQTWTCQEGQACQEGAKIAVEEVTEPVVMDDVGDADLVDPVLSVATVTLAHEELSPECGQAEEAPFR